MNLLQLSWKNLTFKPLSMLLSVILFALGIGLIVLLMLLRQQMEDKFEKNLAGVNLVIGAKGSPLQLILSSMYHIDYPTGNVPLQEVKPFLNPRHPLIQRAVPLSLGDSYRGFRIVGTTPAILSLYQAKLAKGTAFEHHLDVCLGAVAAEKLGLRIGDTFHSTHGMEAGDENLDHTHEDFTVSGILAPSGTVLDQLLLTTPQTYWMVHEQPSTEAAQEPDTLQTADDEHHHEEETEHDHDHHHHEPAAPKSLLEESPDQSITAVLLQFKGRNFQSLNLGRNINENTNLQAANPAFEITRLRDLTDSGQQALKILGIVIIFVSGLSVFISLFNSLKERRYELALLRAMGATPGKLFALIVLEGLLLAAIGCIAGLALGHAGMAVLANTLEGNYQYSFNGWQFLPEELFVVLAAIGLGVLAALLPAADAARTDIAETLTK